MSLARNFKASTSLPNQIALNWDSPIDINEGSEQLIVTKTVTHYPMELFNSNFPDRATDPRPIEIFRGSTIVSPDASLVTVSTNTLTDSGANFPTSPSLAGRLLRDSNSKVHRISSNTSTQLILETEPSAGEYVILPDFTETIRSQENYEPDIRTSVGSGFIKNLVIIENGSLNLKVFEPGELVNLIFKDANGDKFVVKYNTEDTVTFFGSNTPVNGTGMAMLSSHSDSQPLPYIDNFRTQTEADSRQGTKLRDNKFYYYTVFTKTESANVAQAEFAVIDSNASTQDEAISTRSNDFGEILYNLWPSLQREIDDSGDLEDLMKVFGFQFNEIHSLIDTYKLQDADNVLVSALLPLSEQTGLPSVGF